MRYTMAMGVRRAATLAALAAAVALAACGHSEAAEEDAPQPLLLGPEDVAVARVAPIGASVTVSGPLDPSQQVRVRAQAPGTIRGLRVDRGTAVRRGQVMAVIEASGIRSQAAGAKAGVAAAEAAMAVAEQRLDGARTLRQEGAMSEIDFRSVQAAYRAAEAQLAAARAQEASAGEAAQRTTVVAPIDGIVSERQVEEGEAVNPGGELFTVVDPRTLELAGQVGVAEAARVRVGQPVLFTLDAFPGQEFRGTVARKDPTADPGTRQVGIYVQLPNATGRVVGGQFARGRVLTGTAEERVVVPDGAVQTSADTSFVFVVDRGRIVRRVVQLGPRDPALGVVAVLAGVKAGERVLAAPTGELGEGTLVTMAADSSAPKGAAPAAPAKAPAKAPAGGSR